MTCQDKSAVTAVAAVSTILFNEQFKIQKRKKRNIWVTPRFLEPSEFEVYDSLLL